MRYLSSALVAIFLYLSGMAIVQCWLDQVPNSYKCKEKILGANCAKATGLVLGASHAYYGVIPDELDKDVVNAANVSQSIVIDKKLLERWIDRMPQLRYVVLSISYFTMEFKLSSSPEKWRDCFYDHFNDVSEAGLNTKLIDPKYHSLLLSYGPARVVQSWQTPLVTPDQISMSARGWYMGSWNTGATLDDGKRRVDFHHQHCMNQKYLAENMKALDDILALCARKNIKVLIVTPPASDAYLAHIDGKRWQQTVEQITQLSKRYDVSYLNLFDDDRFKHAEYFRDSDHLSPQGAHLFTSILRNNLSRIFLMSSLQRVPMPLC
jgi:hypothetical protein